MSSCSGHQSRFLCPRVPPVNGHLPALSSVFASMSVSDRSVIYPVDPDPPAPPRGCESGHAARAETIEKRMSMGLPASFWLCWRTGSTLEDKWQEVQSNCLERR